MRRLGPPGIVIRSAPAKDPTRWTSHADAFEHIGMTNGKTRLVIPRHNPINALTMGAIAKDVGLTPDQFRALL